MKIKNGYISNSSLTLFCIVGVAVDKYAIGELFDGFNLDEEEAFDFLERKLGNNIFLHSGIAEYSDNIYIIGKRITSMEDNHTLGEFKQQVFNILKAAGYKGKVSDVKIHIEGGCDR